MSCKICYKTEIHRLTKLPQDFNGLLKVIQEVFTTDLPTKFTLEYQDSEGDRVIIHNDEDYKLAIESEFDEKSLKIFLNDASDMDNVSFITRASIDEGLRQHNEQQNVPEPAHKSFEILAEVQEVPVVVVAVEEHERPVEEKQQPMEEKQLTIEIPTSRTQLLTESDNQVDPTEVPLASGVTVISVQRGSRKVNKKTEAMQQIARETLVGELPDIFAAVQEMIDESLAEVKESKKNQRKLNRAVHSRIGCDVCGAFPIVGTRYKCTVLSDYDLCEDCESMNKHPYPVIKIADETQYKHIKALLAEEPFCYGKKQQKKRGCRSRTGEKEKKDGFETVIDNLLEDFAGMNTKDTKCFTEVAEELVGNFKDTMKDWKIDELLTQVEKEIQPQKESQPAQQPEEPQQDTNPKPASSVEEVVGGFVQQLTGGATESIGLLANLANAFAGNWGGFLGELVQNFGVDQKVDTQVDEPKVEKPVIIEEEAIIAEKEVEKYPAEVTKKAEAFVEIFPQANFDDICQYILNAPNKSIEDLVLDYMMGF